LIKGVESADSVSTEMKDFTDPIVAIDAQIQNDQDIIDAGNAKKATDVEKRAGAYAQKHLYAMKKKENDIRYAAITAKVTVVGTEGPRNSTLTEPRR